MSGTSLDGIDAAFLKTTGEKIIGFGPSRGFNYHQVQKRKLTRATRAALKWKFEGTRPSRLKTAETLIDNLHIIAAREIIKGNPCDLIGYHGQTVLHRPPQDGKAGKTLQLGNGQKLADAVKIPCVFDFRTADVEAGGQGAPLAPIYHKALCEYSELSGQIVILNLGGVGNFTLVNGDKMIASDTGPANGPLDSWLARYNIDYDDGGQISAKGKFDISLIDKWLRENPFFKRSGTKSADRYDFDILDDLSGKSMEDGAATLAAFCAASVKHTLQKLDVSPDRLVVSGGGRKNKTILTMLSQLVDCKVEIAEDLGWMGDDIEAQACAFFAVRSKLGLPISFPETTGVPEPMTGGRLVYPNK